MANNDLQLEYGVKFNVKTGGDDATTDIEEYSKAWQTFLNEHKLQIKMGINAGDYDITQQIEKQTKKAKQAADQTGELTVKEKELEKVSRELERTIAKLELALEGETKELLDYKDQLAAANKELKESIAADNAKAGSIDKVKKSLKENLSVLEGMNKSERASSTGMALTETIKKQRAEIALFEKSIKSTSDATEAANKKALAAKDKEIAKSKELAATEEKLRLAQLARQVAIDNAKTVKSALTYQNTGEVYSLKEGSIDEVQNKITRLTESVRIFNQAAAKVGFDDEKLNGATRKATVELSRLNQKLATLQSGFGNRSLNSLLQINPKSIQEANALMAELARRRDALNRTDPGYANSISAINKKQAELSAENARALGISEQKTKAINNETAAFDKQSTVISNLRNMAATYISLYEAGRLVKSIAEVTGQFELQEKSLAAIIQSADKANELFGQVKNLAVVSPFKFSELLSYTKQLAAYRVETDQLYDTMKNLADVSAGLGVDMSRIILAYGQVRAASVLRGQELRQFTEAGIPLVALLADKFTELEGRVVSTGEVFGKISERMVSFEMVKDIFADMSGEGGMFYNMQEIQADTLAGKISNLTDAYQIMFASIGGSESMNGILKGSIDMLTAMARNWKDIAAVILPVVTTIGVYKASMLGLNIVQKAQLEYYGLSQVLVNKQIADNERQIALETRKIGVQSSALMYSKSLAASDALTLFMSGKRTQLNNMEIASLTIKNMVLKAGNDAQKLANLQQEISVVLQGQGMSATMANAAAQKIYTAAVNTSTIATKGFFAAMMATNPVGWIITLISLITTLSLSFSVFKDKVNALGKEIKKIGADGAIEAARLENRFEGLADTITSTTSTVIEQDNALKSLKNIYGEILPQQLLTVEGLKALNGNYKEVTSAINAYIEAKTKEKALDAINKNVDDKISPKLEEFQKILEKAGVSATDARQVLKIFLADVEKDGLKGLTPIQKLSDVLKSFGLKDIFKGTTDVIFKEKLQGVLDALKDIKDKTSELDIPTKKAMYSYTKGFSNVKEAIKEAQSELKQGAGESTFEFNEKKAKIAKEKYNEYLEYIQNATKKITTTKNGKQSSVIEFEGKESSVTQLKMAISQINKEMAMLDSSSFEKTVNNMIQATINTNKKDVKLFDNMFVRDNTSPQEYLDQVSSDYKDTLDKIAKTNESIKNGGSRTELGQEVTELTKKSKLQKQILDYYGELIDKEKKSGGASTVNPRIAAIQAEIDLVIQAKKKYEELVKSGIGAPESKKIVDNLYKDQFKLKYETGDKKGQIIFKTVIDEKGLIGELKTAKSEFKKIPKTEQPVFQVGLKINESEIKIFTDEMKAALSAIEKEFSTNKKRIDLFNTLFETTGDSNLAKKLAESIEGAGTVDLELALNKSFEKAFESLKIDTKPLFDKMGNVDISAAQKEIDKLNPTSEKRVQAQKQLDIVKEFKSKELTELFKGLADFDSYEAKRTAILRKATQERLDIASRTDLSPEVKQQLTDSSKTKEKESLSKLTTEQFKGSELWQTVFGDLDKVSVDSINLLKDRIKEYINIAGKDLAPTEMKEMMKTLEDLQNRTASFDLAAVFKAAFTAIDLQPLKDKVEEAKANVDTLRSIKDGIIVGSTVANDKVLAMQKSGEDKSNPKAYQQALDEQASAANALAVANKNLAASEKDLTKAEKDFTTAANSKKKTLKENEAALNKEIEGMQAVKSAVDNTISAFYSMADAVGLAIDPETKEIIDGITKGLGAVIAVLVAVNSVLVVLEGELGVILLEIWPLLVAFALLMAAISIFKAVKLNGINKELEKQQAIVKNLEKEYAELERTLQKSLGTDWVKAYNQELLNLDKTVTSLTKQIELEKSKGKDADQSKIDEMEKSIDDTNQKIVDSSARLQNFVSGTELVSAASDFANAWLDAYKSFGNTTDAMKGKFKDMINNMVVNTLLAKAMEVALKPIFTAMEAAAEDNVYTPEEIAKIAAETTKSTANADANLTLLMDGLKQAGVDVRDSSTNLTGLSRGIQGITEDTSLLLGGYLDSIRFRLFEYFDTLAKVPQFDMKGSMATLITGQNVQITHLEGIKSNTLRAAVACETLAGEIQSVKAVSTTGTGYALRVNA